MFSCKQSTTAHCDKPEQTFVTFSSFTHLLKVAPFDRRIFHLPEIHIPVEMCVLLLKNRNIIYMHTLFLECIDSSRC